MKKNIRYIFILIILLLSMINLYGMNVSFLIIQKNGLEKVSESSRVFENQIMNTLFDCGHIVTNEPISLFENYETATINGFNAAVDGFMDYFIEIEVDYDLSKSKNPEAVLLENVKSVEYRIKNVLTGTVFFESGKIFPNKEVVSNQFVGFNKFACEIADKITMKLNGK